MREESALTRLRSRGIVVWLTGLSGSGKTTTALALASRLEQAGRLAYVLDGDQLRGGLCSDLGFTPEDRAENVRRAGEVAAILAEAGVIAIVALISPYRLDRERIRTLLGNERFLEIHLSTPIDECERRDVKGLYRRARSGEIAEFTGISSPYEEPLSADLSLDTSRLSVDDAAGRLYELLEQRGIIETAEVPST